MGCDTVEREFAFFPILPAELRLAIWRECLPHRVVELDSPEKEAAFWFLDSPPCELRQTTRANGRPPVISRVCRESRLVALEAGGRHQNSLPAPPKAAAWGSVSTRNSWVDRSRDSVHLNWTPAYEPYYWSDGSALHYLAWKAAHTLGGSFMFDYLDESFDLDVDLEKRLPALQQVSHWVVVMRIIVVHARFETAAKTGLFGLLGDAWVRLVDVSDGPRLDAFYDLAQKCETDGYPSVRQDFHRDSPESIKQSLKSKLASVFGTQARLPPMYPAIMFRLCTNMCNHTLALPVENAESEAIRIGRNSHYGARQTFKSFLDSLHGRR